MGEAKRKSEALETNCICASQEKNRLCPVHWRESPIWGELHGELLQAPKIEENTLGQFAILHPSFPLAWSGKKWVPAIHGLAVGGVQICNFQTFEEALSYVNTNSEPIKTELAALAADIAKQLPAAAARPDHWADPPPDPNAFRCGFCGAWRPPYGLNGQRAEIPGMGLVDYVNFYCGACRAVLAIHVMKTDPGVTLDLGGVRGLPSGFPPGFPRKH